MPHVFQWWHLLLMVSDFIIKSAFPVSVGKMKTGKNRAGNSTQKCLQPETHGYSSLLYPTSHFSLGDRAERQWLNFCAAGSLCSSAQERESDSRLQLMWSNYLGLCSEEWSRRKASGRNQGPELGALNSRITHTHLSLSSLNMDWAPIFVKHCGNTIKIGKVESFSSRS